MEFFRLLIFFALFLIENININIFYKEQQCSFLGSTDIKIHGFSKKIK